MAPPLGATTAGIDKPGKQQSNIKILYYTCNCCTRDLHCLTGASTAAEIRPFLFDLKSALCPGNVIYYFIFYVRSNSFLIDKRKFVDLHLLILLFPHGLVQSQSQIGTASAHAVNINTDMDFLLVRLA